jgi:hypothetical protein
MNDSSNNDALTDYRRRMRDRWSREQREPDATPEQIENPINQKIEVIPIEVIDSDEEEEIEEVNVSRLQEDEELARKLQEEYDREYSEELARDSNRHQQIPVSRASNSGNDQSYQTLEPDEEIPAPQEPYSERLVSNQPNMGSAFSFRPPVNSQFVTTRTVTRNGNTVTQTTRNIPGTNEVVTETRTGDGFNSDFSDDLIGGEDPFASFDRTMQQMRQRMFGPMGGMFGRMNLNNNDQHRFLQ